ncbi:hypothetical protein BDK51DRAFT_26257, partial [Blyttiomyces helicus]
MKSIRRAKAPESQLAGRTISTHSLRSNIPEETTGGPGGGDDWLPPKVLLKPPGQLQLTEAELGEELTRILNANNPHAPQNIARYNHKEGTFKASPNVDHLVVHFEFDGYLIYKGVEENTSADAWAEPGPEATRPAGASGGMQTGEVEVGEEEKKTKGPLRNQFNFSERASQTLNNPYRERWTNTEPPPARTFSYTVNQWSIYDAYIEDLQQKEKVAKEKAKAPAAAGTKGHKDEDKANILPAEAHGEDIYYKNAEVKKALTIVERMANQNTYDDITQDYKYWEDASDELGDRK